MTLPALLATKQNMNRIMQKQGKSKSTNKQNQKPNKMKTSLQSVVIVRKIQIDHSEHAKPVQENHKIWQKVTHFAVLISYDKSRFAMATEKVCAAMWQVRNFLDIHVHKSSGNPSVQYMYMNANPVQNPKFAFFSGEHYGAEQVQLQQHKNTLTSIQRNHLNALYDETCAIHYKLIFYDNLHNLRDLLRKLDDAIIRWKSEVDNLRKL